MSKLSSKSIDRALFRVLKGTPKKELFDTIIDIVNSDYDLHSNSLKEFSPEEISLRLEKILIMGTKKYNKKYRKPYYHYDQALFLKYAKAFTEKIDRINTKDISSYNIVSMKYNFLIKKLRLRDCLNGKRKISLSVKISIIIIGLLAVFELALGSSAADLTNEVTIDKIATEQQGAFAEIVEGYNLAYDLDEKEINFQEEPEISEPEISEPETTIDESKTLDDLIIVEEAPITEDHSVTEEILIKEEPTNEEKIDYILEEYGTTEEQLEVVCAVVCAEALAGSYEDAYWVINAVYNRSISKKWNQEMIRLYGEKVDPNIYYQIAAKNQFEAYSNGSYKKFLGVTDDIRYQAVIDFLYTRELKHNYLSFKADFIEVQNHFQPVSSGNKFHNIMQDEDRLDIELTTISR